MWATKGNLQYHNLEILRGRIREFDQCVNKQRKGSTVVTSSCYDKTEGTLSPIKRKSSIVGRNISQNSKMSTKTFSFSSVFNNTLLKNKKRTSAEPEEWKRRNNSCQNYRGISLFNVAYKVLASISSSISVLHKDKWAIQGNEP